MNDRLRPVRVTGWVFGLALAASALVAQRSAVPPSHGNGTVLQISPTETVRTVPNVPVHRVQRPLEHLPPPTGQHSAAHP